MELEIRRDTLARQSANLALPAKRRRSLEAYFKASKVYSKDLRQAQGLSTRRGLLVVAEWPDAVYWWSKEEKMGSIMPVQSTATTS